MKAFRDLALPILLCALNPALVSGGTFVRQWTPPAHLEAGPESGEVAAFDEDGAPRWTARWTMSNGSRDGQDVVLMTEEGAGRYSGFDVDVEWQTETVWLRTETFRPLESEKVFRSADGMVLERLHTAFDWEAEVVRFERELVLEGTTDTETRDLPLDTLFAEGMAAALRSMPFDEGDSVDASLFTTEPELYEVTFEIRGPETLAMSDGEIDAYKVEVVPHLGFLSVFRFLAPDTYFWFAADDPHTWVRYTGPENGRGTPDIRIDRIDGSFQAER